MPTIEQIRAARALIGWSQGELAEHAGLSQTGIARIENGTNQPNSSTLAKIVGAFDKADVEFIGETGVKKRTGEVRMLRGKTGLIEFMDDVYTVAQRTGGKMYFYNIFPENWLDVLGEEWWNFHVERMAKHNNKTNIKILVPEGNSSFISSRYAQYRWFPKGFELSKQRSLYAYGDKLGFVTFHQDIDLIEILILQSPDFVDGVRALFEIAWDQVAKVPEQTPKSVEKK